VLLSYTRPENETGVRVAGSGQLPAIRRPVGRTAAG